MQPMQPDLVKILGSIPIIDLYPASSPGSLMRACRVAAPGLWRMSRVDCELYSVQIVGAGSFTRIRALNGDFRSLWEQPSTFTGSFWLSAGASNGLLMEIASMDLSGTPNLLVNFREIVKKRARK
jgi:hypothetical protein